MVIGSKIMIKIELSKYQVCHLLEALEAEMYRISELYQYKEGIWESPEWETEYNDRKELRRVLTEELNRV